jgi:hypothetical protein
MENIRPVENQYQLPALAQSQKPGVWQADQHGVYWQEQRVPPLDPKKEPNQH